MGVRVQIWKELSKRSFILWFPFEIALNRRKYAFKSFRAPSIGKTVMFEPLFLTEGVNCLKKKPKYEKQLRLLHFSGTMALCNHQVRIFPWIPSNSIHFKQNSGHCTAFIESFSHWFQLLQSWLQSIFFCIKYSILSSLPVCSWMHINLINLINCPNGLKIVVFPFFNTLCACSNNAIQKCTIYSSCI